MPVKIKTTPFGKLNINWPKKIIVSIIYNMEPMYKKYIDKHGNFSHNLNIEIDESLSEDEKIQLFTIYLI